MYANSQALIPKIHDEIVDTQTVNASLEYHLKDGTYSDAVMQDFRDPIFGNKANSI